MRKLRHRKGKPPRCTGRKAEPYPNPGMRPTSLQSHGSKEGSQEAQGCSGRSDPGRREAALGLPDGRDGPAVSGLSSEGGDSVASTEGLGPPGCLLPSPVELEGTEAVATDLSSTHSFLAY